MQKFNLEAALQGAPVFTERGDKVTQLHLYDIKNHPYPLHGVINGYVYWWNKEGETPIYNLNRMRVNLCMGDDYQDFIKKQNSIQESKHNVRSNIRKIAMDYHNAFIQLTNDQIQTPICSNPRIELDMFARYVIELTNDIKD